MNIVRPFLQIASHMHTLKESQRRLQEAELMGQTLTDKLAEVNDEAAFDAQRCKHLEAEVAFQSPEILF